MLTLHKVSSRRAASYAAYLTALEPTGDYLLGPDGDPWVALGSWLGKLAAWFHLAGRAVDFADLIAVLSGRDPRTGELCTLRWRADRVAAHDLVFSAPSSVTAVWALAGEGLRAAIQEGHDNAVSEAFRYIERHVEVVRRREGGTFINEPAVALLGAAFAHHTSRQTAAQARAGVPPDPQVHTHVLLAGMAKRSDGHLVAINSLALHWRRAEAGAVYRAALAASLRGLGFAIERKTGRAGRYFEIAGVPQELREVWSSRRQEIEQHRQGVAATRGREPDVVEVRELAVRSREPKGQSWRGDLRRFWADTAAHLGVTPQTIEQLRRGGSEGGSEASTAQGQALLMAELLALPGEKRVPLALRLEAYQRAAGLLAPAEVETVLRRLGPGDGAAALPSPQPHSHMGEVQAMWLRVRPVRHAPPIPLSTLALTGRRSAGMAPPRTPSSPAPARGASNEVKGRTVPATPSGPSPTLDASNEV